VFVVVVVSKKPYNVVRTGLFGFGFEERGSLVENLVFVVVLSLAGSLVRSSNQLRARAFGAAEEARADGRNDASGPPGKFFFFFCFFFIWGLCVSGVEALSVKVEIRVSCPCVGRPR